MKRILLATAAALMFAGPLATTAFAQPQYHDGGRSDRNYNDRGDYRNDRDNDRGYRNWQPINQRQNMLENRIRAGIRSGRIDRTEARYLRAEFQQIARVEARYRRDGLSRAERRELDRRFDSLTMHLQAALHDNNRRRG